MIFSMHMKFSRPMSQDKWLSNLIDLLIPLMEPAQMARARVIEAFGPETPILQALDLTGAPQGYITNIIRDLYNFGDYEGENALVHLLLDFLKNGVTGKRQEFIALINEIDKRKQKESPIFLTGSRHDVQAIWTVREELIRQGRRVLTDDLEDNRTRRKALVELALARASAVIVLMTANTPASPIVQSDLALTNEAGLKVIGLLIPSADTPDADIPSIEGVDSHVASIQELLTLLPQVTAVRKPPSAQVGVLQAQPSYKLRTQQWEMLLSWIDEGKVVPFLGPGVCPQIVDTQRKLAAKWADDAGFVFSNRDDLAQVAQYVALMQYQNRDFTRQRVAKQWYEEVRQLNFRDVARVHSNLAELPLPLYVTCNYDDLLSEALRKKNRDPKRVIYTQASHTEISVASPMVYHMYGYHEQYQSMVITEEDYLDYLVNVSHANYDVMREVANGSDGRPMNAYRLPSALIKSLTTCALLFVGFTLTDWNFRILYRLLIDFLKRNPKQTYFLVQVTPSDHIASVDAVGLVHTYLSRYYSPSPTQVYLHFADTAEFVDELIRRRG
jgi:hypothetical protein